MTHYSEQATNCDLWFQDFLQEMRKKLIVQENSIALPVCKQMLFSCLPGSAPLCLKLGKHKKKKTPQLLGQVFLTKYKLLIHVGWRRKWQSTPVFLPGKSHGQRSLVGYSPWVARVRYDLVTKAFMQGWNCPTGHRLQGSYQKAWRHSNSLAGCQLNP